MAVIAINGVPGSGKTTIAVELAKRLGIEQIIQTDTIKEFLQVTNHPEIAYCASHNSWRFFGEKNMQNIIKGLYYHLNYFEDILLKIIELTQREGKNIIVEGVQITPNIFSKIRSKDKIGFYLTIDEKERIRRFDLKNQNRSKKNYMWYDNLDVIVALDQYLKTQSIKNSLIILDNISKCYSVELMQKEISKRLNFASSKQIISIENE